MISLRESLEELIEANANRVLTDSETPAGRQALARMTLLLSMIERLDANGGSWSRCDLLPEEIPLLSGISLQPAASLIQ